MFTSDQIGGILRAVLAAAGGSLVAKGVVDQATATAVTGGLVTILTALWSWWSNKQSSMISSINSADNGVKVVANASPGAVVNAPMK